jgi:RNA polymerase sigma-70 factor (ECF subfamily)
MTRAAQHHIRRPDSCDKGPARTAAPVDRLSNLWFDPSPDPKTEIIRDNMVRLLPRLRQFSRSLTRDRDRSEDLMQETFVRALRNLDQWRPGSRLDSWMFRIAQNLWIDHLRSEKSRGEVVDITTLGNLSDCDGRVVTEYRLALREVRAGIDEMPRDLQLLLKLVCVDGLSCQKAAAALDTPVGIVTRRLARARQSLHERTGRTTSPNHAQRGPSRTAAGVANSDQHQPGRAST